MFSDVPFTLFGTSDFLLRTTTPARSRWWHRHSRFNYRN